MESGIEIEFKIQVADIEALKKYLANLSFTGVTHTEDIYLDTVDGSLFKRGIFIRIRDGKKVDFKFNLEDILSTHENLEHAHCNELSFTLPLKRPALKDFNDVCKVVSLKKIDKPNLKEFMKKNHLIESMVIEKKRLNYKDGNYEVSYDLVEGLGDFLEIEFLAKNDREVEKIKSLMMKRLSNLKHTLINTGYNELYWRKNNFDLYLQGKYLLQEDFDKYRRR